MKKYALCGAGVGLTLLVLAFMAAGGGHGTYIPCMLFFAPLVLLSLPLTLLGGGILLYVAYAILLHWGSRRSQEASIYMIIMVVLFHLWGLGWSIIIIPQGWEIYENGVDTPALLMIAYTPLILAIIASVYVVLKYPARKDEIKQHGKHCRQCSYNLTGNVSGVCPECGTPIHPVIPPSQPYQRTKGLESQPGHSHQHRRR